MKLGVEKNTFGRLLHATFHPHWCNLSLLWGITSQKWLVRCVIKPFNQSVPNLPPLVQRVATVGWKLHNHGLSNLNTGISTVHILSVIKKIGCSFVRSLRQGSSLLWTPVLRPYSGPVRLLRERKGIGRCVRCMLATCTVKEGLSRSEQLVGYFYSAPLLDVAYCLA